MLYTIALNQYFMCNSCLLYTSKGPRMFVSGPALTSIGGHGDSHFSPQILNASLGIVVNGADAVSYTHLPIVSVYRKSGSLLVPQ